MLSWKIMGVVSDENVMVFDVVVSALNLQVGGWVRWGLITYPIKALKTKFQTLNDHLPKAICNSGAISAVDSKLAHK